MSDVKFHKHKVFRETEDVTFYDISVPQSNASDLVIHETTAISPPDDKYDNKQFYIHYHQIDNNRVISGERTFELINFDWERPLRIKRVCLAKVGNDDFGPKSAWEILVCVRARRIMIS